MVTLAHDEYLWECIDAPSQGQNHEHYQQVDLHVDVYAQCIQINQFQLNLHTKLCPIGGFIYNIVTWIRS